MQIRIFPAVKNMQVVFNILFGQEVTILVDELKPAGIHEVKFHPGLNLTFEIPIPNNVIFY